jgi:hypothetical protein
MRFRVRHLCLAVIVVGFLVFLATGDHSRRHYCPSCGLMRLSWFRTCFGLVVRRSTQYRDTEFHRLLLSAGQVECSHRWQAFYWNHHNIGPGEIHIPLILTDSTGTSLLWRIASLEDPDRRFAILTSFDLTEVLDQHYADTDSAFAELGAVAGAAGEQKWWRKHQDLFGGRLPLDRALRRTRPVVAASGR